MNHHDAMDVLTAPTTSLDTLKARSWNSRLRLEFALFSLSRTNSSLFEVDPMSIMSFLCGLLPGRCGCEAPEPGKQARDKTSSAKAESDSQKPTKPAHEPPTTTEGRHTG